MFDSYADDELADAVCEYLLDHPICDLLKIVAMVVEAKELADAGQ